MFELRTLAIILFLVFVTYYLYILPLDKNQKLVGILGAIGSIALIITIYQASQQYQYQVDMDVIRFSSDYWGKILDATSDELYHHWYDGDFNGLTLKRHEEWSRIATDIETIDYLNGFTKKQFDFTGNEGWRMLIHFWVHDPEFQLYWEQDKMYYDEQTILLIDYFLSLSAEENERLANEEREKSRSLLIKNYKPNKKNV